MFKKFDLRLFEEIGGNFQEKKNDKMGETGKEKKSTLRAFALWANKPCAGKFAKDWKKSLKNSIIRGNSSITDQSLL
jgi:hypothetical protein